MCLVFPKKMVFAMESPTHGTTQSAICVNTYRHIIRCMHVICAGRVEHCHCFAIILFGHAQHTQACAYHDDMFKRDMLHTNGMFDVKPLRINIFDKPV